MMNKKAQDEMVGFAVIVIIIGVILLVAIGFLVNTRNESVVQDYEVESFIESSLQYTTECQDSLGYLSIQELIISCKNSEICLNGNSSCDTLNNTLGEITKEGWNVGEQSPIKAYEFSIMTDDQIQLTFNEGNKTANYKAGMQNFARNGVEYGVTLNLYS
jgi:hypothetical protein